MKKTVVLLVVGLAFSCLTKMVFAKSDKSAIEFMEITPDSKYLITARANQIMDIWSLDSMEIICSLKKQGGKVTGLDVSPDGKLLVVAYVSGIVRYWSLKDQKLKAADYLFANTRFYIHSVKYSQAGDIIYMGTENGKVFLFDVKKNRSMTRFKCSDWRFPIIDIAFPEEENYFVTLNDRGDLSLCDRENGAVLWRLGDFNSNLGAIISMDVSTDGKYLIVGRYDGTIQLYNVKLKKVERSLEGHEASVVSLKFLQSGNVFISGDANGFLKIWSVKNSKCIDTISETKSKKRFFAIDYRAGELITNKGNGSIIKHSIMKYTVNNMVFSYMFINENDVALKSSTAKVITKLPINTKVTTKMEQGGFVYVKVGDLQGWVKIDYLSDRPRDIIKPVIRVLEKEFIEPNLKVKGVVYDDNVVSVVVFGDKILKRQSFKTAKGNYSDAYPFSFEAVVTPGMVCKIFAYDDSQNSSNISINIVDPVFDYSPKYVHLEVLRAAPIRKDPSTDAEKISSVKQREIVLSVGRKGKWYCLDGGGWIFHSVVKETFYSEKEEEQSVDLVVKRKVIPPSKLKKVSDIDVDIPLGKANKNGIGVIICIRNYDNDDVPSVDYAHNDGMVMQDYFTKLFGLSKDNIILIKDAKKSDFERLFGTKDDYKGQIYNWVKRGESDVYVYYVGHGAPDVKTKEAYFIPADAHPNYVRFNGYSMDVLCNNLSKIPARSHTLILDACFSGRSEKGMIIAKASGIAVVPKTKFSGTLFTASSGDEVASWYPEQQHSLFTYYFLKGLRGAADSDKSRSVTVGELGAYITEKVSYRARREYNREQTPEVKGNANKVLIRYR